MGKRKASDASVAKKAKTTDNGSGGGGAGSAAGRVSAEGITGLVDTVKQDLEAIKTAALANADEEDTATTDELNARLKTFAAKVTAIKILARQLAVRVVDSTERVKQAKQGMEATHLQLQNVLYEHLHVLNEIKTCQSYRSRAEDLELVTRDEYLASDAASGEDKDEHHEMLGRLQFEAEERARLRSDLEERQYRKTAISNINEKKRAMIKAAPDAVTHLLDACNKCSDVFGPASMPHDELLAKFRASHPLADRLPAPLHALLMTVAGYNIAYEARSWSVHIAGDAAAVDKFEAEVDACETYMYALARKEQGDNDDVEDERDEDDEDEEEGGKRSKDAHKSQTGQSKTATAPANLHQLLFTPHPLSLELKSTPDAAKSLRLVFRHYPLLHIVTTTEQSPKTQLPVLQHVAPADSGKTPSSPSSPASPPPPVMFMLDRLGVEDYRPRLTGTIVPAVQDIAGLTDAGSTHARHTATKVLHAVRIRFKHMSELQADIATLKTLKFPAVKESFETFPLPGKATITKCVVERPKDAATLCTVNLSLKRDDIEVTAVMTLPLEYPAAGATFAINFTKSPADVQSLRVSVQAMANECSRWEDFEAKRARIFAYQTRRLQMCLDLVAELQDSIRKDQPSQWCKAIYNGPEHSLPFHWDADARLFVLPHAST